MTTKGTEAGHLTSSTGTRDEACGGVRAVPAAVLFACLQGVLAAVVQVTRTNLTWLVAQTQPTMSLRVVLQMISGVSAITLAPLAAGTAKRVGGVWLVAALAFLVVPLSVGMSLMVAGGSVLVRHILSYGIAVALIQAFSYSAHEEFLCRLVGVHADSARIKALVVRLRNTIQFAGRIVLWMAPPRNLWVRCEVKKGIAHPAANLLRDMWANTDPSAGERQDAGEEYSESGREVQGFCV